VSWGDCTTFTPTTGKKSSKKPLNNSEKEALRACLAPESGKYAQVGGALIPLLTLEFPGSASTAVFNWSFIYAWTIPVQNYFQAN